MNESHKKMVIDTYNATVKEYVEHEFENPQMEKYYKKFLEYLPEKSYILDVGCGPGQAAHKFVKKGHKVLGIDLSKKMISFAKQKTPKAKFMVMDVEKMSLKQKFDGIWAAFVLLHVDRKKIPKIIKKFYSLLKPNGVLFLGMIKGKGEKTILEPYNRNYNQRLVYTTKKEIQTWLKSNNFKLKSYIVEDYPEEGEIFKLTFSQAYAIKKIK